MLLNRIRSLRAYRQSCRNQEGQTYQRDEYTRRYNAMKYWFMSDIDNTGNPVKNKNRKRKIKMESRTDKVTALVVAAVAIAALFMFNTADAKNGVTEKLLIQNNDGAYLCSYPVRTSLSCSKIVEMEKETPCQQTFSSKGYIDCVGKD